MNKFSFRRTELIMFEKMVNVKGGVRIGEGQWVFVGHPKENEKGKQQTRTNQPKNQPTSQQTDNQTNQQTKRTNKPTDLRIVKSRHRLLNSRCIGPPRMH